MYRYTPFFDAAPLYEALPTFERLEQDDLPIIRDVLLERQLNPILPDQQQANNMADPNPGLACCPLPSGEDDEPADDCPRDGGGPVVPPKIQDDEPYVPISRLPRHKRRRKMLEVQNIKDFHRIAINGPDGVPELSDLNRWADIVIRINEEKVPLIQNRLDSDFYHRLSLIFAHPPVFDGFDFKPNVRLCTTCKGKEIPTWDFCKISSEANVDLSYCGHHTRYRLHSPWARSGEKREISVCGNVSGFPVEDTTEPTANYERKLLDVRIGGFVRAPEQILPARDWFTHLACWFDDLYYYDRVVQKVESLKGKFDLHSHFNGEDFDETTIWWDFTPEVYFFMERAGSLVGNNVTRRAISNAPKEASGAMTRNPRSLSVLYKLLDQAWCQVSKQSQGSEFTTPDWFFIKENLDISKTQVLVNSQIETLEHNSNSNEEPPPETEKVTLVAEPGTEQEGEQPTVQVVRDDQPGPSDKARGKEKEEKDVLDADRNDKDLVHSVVGGNAQDLVKAIKICSDLDVDHDKRPQGVDLNLDDVNSGFVKTKLPEFQLAHRTVGGQEVAPIGPVPLGVKLDQEKMKFTASSGVMLVNKFGNGCMAVADNTIGSTSNAFLARSTKARKDQSYSLIKNGVTHTRIKNGDLYFPLLKTLDKKDRQFLDEIGILEESDDLKKLWEKMNKRQRERYVQLYNEICDCTNYPYKDEIPVFIKNNDKTGKDKPRVIQFVNSIAWMRTTLTIEACLKKIKTGNGDRPWGWEDKKSGIYYIWASGMTQGQLAKAYEWATQQHDGLYPVFLCGDDNTDPKSCNDAGSYDTSQWGIFFARQLKFLNKMGLAESDIDYIRRVHKAKRTTDGLTVDLPREMLPSGAPWTLFLNTIGLVVFWTQMSHCGRDVQVASDLLGLDMDSVPNPNIDGLNFSGSEFLKMANIRVGDKCYPCPLPSRIIKWSAKNFKSKTEALTWNDSKLLDHVAQVAKGQSPFVMDPYILGPFVDGWSKRTSKDGIAVNKYTITPGDLKLHVGLEKWEDAWVAFYSTRYGLSRVELESMRAEIVANYGKMHHFQGNNWTTLFATDYGGKQQAFLAGAA